MPEPPILHAKRRLASIDILRGLAMILMTLDYVRGIFGIAPFEPESISQTSMWLFFTRWISHLCAPVFVFLAGCSARLYEAKGRAKPELARYLCSRGLWLVFLEIAVVNTSFLNYAYGNYVLLHALWALGWCMVLLAAMVWLPKRWIAVIAVFVIVGHHVLDPISAGNLGPWKLPFALLHEQNVFLISGRLFAIVMYPLFPWVGVMAAGYVIGELFFLDPETRCRKLFRLGVLLTAAFAVLRVLNGYGDPNPWVHSNRGWIFTMLAFLNTTKYPASLMFLCMTLGPALMLLAWMEGCSGRACRLLRVFGRTPLFYYLLQNLLIHLFAIVWTYSLFGRAPGWWAQGRMSWPSDYSPNPWWIYGIWLLVVFALFPLCRWFGSVKDKRPNGWLSYL